MFSWHGWLSRVFRQARTGRRPATRLRSRRLRLEELEGRLAPATYIVTTPGDGLAVPGKPNDDGTIPVTTLRGAINAVDGHKATDPADTIRFAAGVTSIPVGAAAGLPLPSITHAVLIDGTVAGQAGPGVELNGSAVNRGDAAARNGLTITAGKTTVQGLIINRFSAYGIVLQTGGGNVLTTDYIGTDAKGTTVNDGAGTRFGNGKSGVLVLNSSDDTVGGAADGKGNVISGNQENGVEISGAGSKNNVVQNDLIGASAAGQRFGFNKDQYGNQMSGVVLKDGASNNVIGATTLQWGNNLSNNQHNGVLITGDKTTGNWVQGNTIGCDTKGALPLANGQAGLLIQSAPGNLIGVKRTELAPLLYLIEGTGNVISGNAGDGVKLTGARATKNIISGNVIGPAEGGADGLIFATVKVGNQGNGVLLDGAVGNQIGGAFDEEANVISVNFGDGIQIKNGSGNKVWGNLIGLNKDGDRALPNSGNGVTIQSSKGNFIGPDGGDGRGNVISGNGRRDADGNLKAGGDGVLISDIGSTGNKVRGNIIGLNKGGTRSKDKDSNPLGNGANGVNVNGAGPGNIIGGTSNRLRNVISANGQDGVLIQSGNGSGGTTVEGNYIGTDAGGRRVADRGDGIFGNQGDGVEVLNSSNNTIEQNTISGQLVRTVRGADGKVSVAGGNGVEISDKGSKKNKVLRNRIGTTATGDGRAPNALNGVLIDSASQTDLTANTISANAANGVLIRGKDATKNTLERNFIGTDKDGNVTVPPGKDETAALGNGFDGVLIDNATDNTVGSSSALLGNVISGNGGSGVHVKGAQASKNVVSGNMIGTDVKGKITDPTPKVKGSALGNRRDGVFIEGAPDNVVGKPAGGKNVIAGNFGNGVQIKGAGATGNTVAGNNIGADVDAKNPLLNGLAGVRIDGAGGNKAGLPLDPNTIFYSDGQQGVAVLSVPAGAPANVRSNTEKGFKPTQGSQAPPPAAGLTAAVLVLNSPGTVVTGNVLTGDASGDVGIATSGATSTGVRVEGNTATGFGAAGVLVTDSASGNTIDAANSIHDNGGDGVRVESGTGNAILSNAIYANGGLGINLVGGSEDGFGVTANHAGGAVPGANHLQNYPLLTSAVLSGTTLTVSGVLDSGPNGSYLVELYANPAADPSGHGEGQQLLGSLNVATDGSGAAAFSLSFAAASGLLGASVSATATDLQSFDTSEFSGDVAVRGNYPPVAANDSYTTAQDTPLNVPSPGVLLNDSDPDGDPLTAVLASGPASGTLTLNANGSFTYTPSAGFSGTDTFTYTAFDGLFSSNVATVTISVTPVSRPTTTVVTGLSNPSAYGQPVAFTAIVAASGSGSGVPTGSVQFEVDGSAFGAPVPLTAGSVTSASTATLSVGPHTIDALYAGDGSFAASAGTATQTVNPDGTTAVLVSDNPTSVFGQPVTFTATVVVVAPGVGIPTGTVAFKSSSPDGTITVTLGTGTLDSSGRAQFQIAVLVPAPHTVFAVYVGDGNDTGSTSAPVTQVVQPADTAVGLTAAATTVASGQLVDFTVSLAAVAPGALIVVPSGTVTLYDTFNGSTTVLGSLDASGSLTAALPLNGPGTHVITAAYGGDGNFNGSISPPLAVMVMPSGAAISVSSSAPSSVCGQAVTFTASVAPAGMSALTPTGTIQFLVDGSPFGAPVPLAGGVATSPSLATLPAGPHAVTAFYSGDAHFAPGDAFLTQQVDPADTTLVLTSSSPAITFGDPLSLFTTLYPVAPGSFVIPPTGTTTVYDTFNGTTTVLFTIEMGGWGSFPPLAVGMHVITAVYSGDANFNGSTSDPLTLIVNPSGSP